MDDADRSAFGLGWENNRRGEDCLNPFPITDWKYFEFERGYLSYRATDPNKVYDPITFQEQ